MSFKNLMSLIISVTFVMLCYVHLQTEVFRVSYSIAAKEKRLSQLSDQYRELKFEVSRLKSLTYLDKKRREKDVALVAPEQVKTIRVPMPASKITDEAATGPEYSPMLKKSLTSVLGMIKEAQAKMSR